MNKKETMTGLSKETEPILIYLVSILGFIFSFLKDEVDKEARWVYNQAGAIFITYASVGIISSGIFYIPIFGIVVAISCWMVEVALVVFSIIAIVKAYHGEHYEIPVISDLAKSIWIPEEKTTKKTTKVKEVEVKKETKKSAKKGD